MIIAMESRVTGNYNYDNDVSNGTISNELE